jgi:hypothetical protein
MSTGDDQTKQITFASETEREVASIFGEMLQVKWVKPEDVGRGFL